MIGEVHVELDYKLRELQVRGRVMMGLDARSADYRSYAM